MSRTLARTAFALLSIGACARAPSTTQEAGEPAPLSEVEAICAHSYELLIVPTGAGSDAVREDFVTRCASNSEQRRASLSPEVWSARSACVLAARDRDELGICDGRQPELAPPQPTLDAAHSAARLCTHLFELIAAEGVTPVQTDLDSARADCEKSVSENIAEDPEAFERIAPCAFAARSLAQLDACED